MRSCTEPSRAKRRRISTSSSVRNSCARIKPRRARCPTPRPSTRLKARTRMQIEVSVLSNPGGRERNEDAYGFWTGDGGCFCVVSDGAGGHGGGDVASKLAVRVILAGFQESAECTGAAIDAALTAAHRAIIAQQGTQAALSGMRATATALAIDTVHHTAVWG